MKKKTYPHATPPPLYPLSSELNFTRRSFLIGGASFAAAALLSNRVKGAITTAPKFSSYPFTLGIASGDPAPDGFVLWTRLAPSPLEPGGGMPADPVEVSWQVAEDERMSKIVQRGKATATPMWGHSVHVEVEGLKPDRWYWYQFKTGSEISGIGRTRTMPAAGVTPDRLRFAFASCAKYEVGYYTAYRHMAEEDCDLIFHLGDYIYESHDSSSPVPIRPHHTGVCMTLDQYRARYALGKTDPDLQAAHAVAPWIVTWDDHEVSNDYADAISQDPEEEPPREFLIRHAAAYQAYYEHMPLRRRSLPDGPDMLLYRRLNYGQLASFNVLDTRQYRTDQPCGVKSGPPCPGVYDSAATIMGHQQRAWLVDGLDYSKAGWNILAQQVLMGRVDFTPGPDVKIALDKWSGYEFERRNLLRNLRDHPVANPLFLSGDIHTNWANDLTTDFDSPDAPSVAVELVCTSVTSNGDGVDKPDYTDALLKENPFVKYHNSERGYVRCEVTPDKCLADFRTVPYVSRRGAPIQTRASFQIDSGDPKLQRI